MAPRGTALPEIFHETGVRQAFAIVQTGRVGSITPPHPAELLMRPNHAQFRKIERFKGRGVLFRFE